jgi:ABC-type sugar transport system permease subunit
MTPSNPSPRGGGFSAVPLPWLLLAPFFSGFVLFWLVPLVQGFLLSFHSDTLFGEPAFVGLAHYAALLRDSRFLHALSNTALYALGTIVTIVPLALLLAHLLHATYARLRPALTFFLLLPGLTPPAVLALLFLLVFLGSSGLLNTALSPLGLPAIDWIRNPDVIKVSLILQAIWRWTGFAAFFFLAGLTSIPATLHSAARVEGASAFQIAWRVNLPMLKNVILFVSLFLLIDAFVLFEGAYVILGSSGGTADAGLLLVSYAYTTAFTLGRFGSASAMSFFAVPLVALAVWLLLFSRRTATPEEAARTGR